MANRSHEQEIRATSPAAPGTLSRMTRDGVCASALPTALVALLLAPLLASCLGPADLQPLDDPPRFPDVDLWIIAGPQAGADDPRVHAWIMMTPVEPTSPCDEWLDASEVLLNGDVIARIPTEPDIATLARCHWEGDAPRCTARFLDGLATLARSDCPLIQFDGVGPGAVDVVDFDVELRSGEETVSFHVGPMSPATARSAPTATAGGQLHVLGIPVDVGAVSVSAAPVGADRDQRRPELWDVALHADEPGAFVEIPNSAAGDYSLVFYSHDRPDIDRCEFHSCAPDVAMHSLAHPLTVISAGTVDAPGP